MGEVIDENGLEAPHIRYRHKVPRRPGRATTSAGRWRWSAPTPASASASPPASCGCARATTATRAGLHARVARHGRLQGPHRAPADLARRPRPERQAGGRDRLGRHRRDADPGDGRMPARTSRCCSARRPTSAPARNATNWPTCCASWTSPKPGRTRSCAARSCSSRASSPEMALRHPDAVKRELVGQRAQHPGARLRRRDPLHPHYRPWRQRLAFMPDADLFQGIASGKASVVTDEIEMLHREGLRLKSGEDARRPT
jgi:cation diffusion facilitator CzcD-associated flavoprotein CzcO